MKFIIKLFKALNSGQTPWQVTLAIVLGMIMGLTPISGIQTVVIFFLALLLNIHFGLFLISAAFFAGVGYIFDPLFESFGYWLLNAAALKGLWTSMYNSGIMRLTYFNNTIVLGSFAAAAILALPLYIVLNRIILTSRDKISAFLDRYPLLAKLGILKKSEKKDSAFRILGVGVFAGLGALVTVTAMFVIDPVIKLSLEKGISKATGKDVLIKSVKTSFSDASLHVNGLEVQNNDGKTNSVSIADIIADLDFNALLLHKKHMELVQMTGIGFDTPSSNPKHLATKEQTAKKLSKTESAFKMPDIKLPTPKEVLANADLKSVKVYDKAQKEIGEIKAKWEKISKEQFGADALEGYKKDLDAIKSASSSKDPAELLKLKDKIAEFKKKIDADKAKLASIKKDFAKDQAHIKALMAEVKNAPADDYKNLKSTYSLDGNGAINVVGAVFGDRVKHYIAMAKRYYALAAPYMKTEKKIEPPKPPRGEGRWIKFKENTPSPDIYVAKVELGGKFKTQSFTGVINDITDDQKLLGKVTTFKVTSDGDVVQKFALNGKDDRLGKEAHESVVFSAKNIASNDLALSSLSIKKSNIALEGKADIYDLSKLQLASSFNFKNAVISLEGLDKKYADIVNDTLSSVKNFHVKTDATGSLETPAVHVSTDLDKKISEALNGVFAKEAKKYEAQLKTMLNDKMKDQLKGLGGTASGLPDINSLVGSQSGALDGLLSQSSGLGKGSSGSMLKGLLPF
ncbi:TIGR03545 family protein [Sulfurimonas sp. HSL-1716]|uniref:TIGR03545 family protein n=1 Tax=Hydrocurvibacter sulfurireducens TaxID=3131937 RepID=UPI0031F93207